VGRPWALWMLSLRTHGSPTPTQRSTSKSNTIFQDFIGRKTNYYLIMCTRKIAQLATNANKTKQRDERRTDLFLSCFDSNTETSRHNKEEAAYIVLPR